MLVISPSIAVREDELHEEFVRASGPGGQNVNKVSTAVRLFFDVRHSPSLPADVRARLTRLAGRRVSSAGVLVIDARRFRTQDQNRADARERLAALIRQAAVPPTPRHKTRPTRAAKERRLASKKQRGETKRLRRVDER